MNKRHIEILKEMIIDFNEYSTDYTKTRCREIEQVLIDTVEEIEQLQQENQQLKKQKDDVVELIKKQLLSNTNITKYTDEMCLRDVLRMLGEIDVED